MIEGTVENGTRGQLATSFYTGKAGAQRRERGLEIAYSGKPPKPSLDLSKEKATFDGRAITIVKAVESRTPGMVVLTVREAE